MPANEICGLRLDFLPCLRVDGADADNFLQGQFSNDIRRLTTELGQISSYSNPKGRMLAVLHLLRRVDGIHLELHHSVHDSILKRLRMFVLRSQVTLEASRLQSLGVLGSGAAEFLRCAGLPDPESPLGCASRNGITVMRRIGAVPRFSLHGSESALACIEGQLPATASVNDWLLADIEAGVPTIYAETQDRFVPQWCNLDQLDGISFDKGCYTGQEIVARMHYLGSVKRRMVRATSAVPAPVPGLLLFMPDNDQSVGEIVQAVTVASGCAISAVVQTTYSNAELRMGSAHGPLLKLN